MSLRDLVLTDFAKGWIGAVEDAAKWHEEVATELHEREEDARQRGARVAALSFFDLAETHKKSALVLRGRPLPKAALDPEVE